MPNKILSRLNKTLYRAINSLTDDCKHLRKQLIIEKSICNVETLDILKQFKSIAISRSLDTDDKVDKMIELSCYYISKYEKRINSNQQVPVNSFQENT